MWYCEYEAQNMIRIYKMSNMHFEKRFSMIVECVDVEPMKISYGFRTRINMGLFPKQIGTRFVSVSCRTAVVSFQGRTNERVKETNT